MQFTPAIQLIRLTKCFDSVTACDCIDLDVRRGEILALLGENGSGKTTLTNMLSGIYQPDAGQILLDGKPVIIRSPRDAIRQGIGMIHQHFKLVEVMTARENILLGQQSLIKTNPEDAVKAFGLKVGLNKKVYDMSVSEKQTVEILKVLCRGADKLILDEPTAVLTPQEIQSLFDTLHAMRKEGKAIIIITHKLEEVMAVSDRVTVLRKGVNVGTVGTGQTDRFSLTEMMVGQAIDLDVKRVETPPGQPLLRLDKVSAEDDSGRTLLKDISFTLNQGEILGVAGVAGSGQKALCEIIAGLENPSGGTITLDKQPINGLSPREIIKRGISMAFIPEDRLGMGLVGGLNIPDNLLLKTYRDQKGFFLKRKPARLEGEEMIRKLKIVTPGLNVKIRKLSGGNVQKVLLGREINLSPKVLITAYPVRGLDIGASMTIYDMLNEQKRKGVGILFVGEDLDVLISLCDRILVLCAGKVSAIVESQFATKALLGMKMTGLKTDKEDEYA
ncbi:MAG: ABC transporter ATP-binding protein [Clostridiales bacterium]|jgi:simple sugar transport system ATP-binding protein|nr:ABC transporter ATP-binding protein [Clostridiales bacterium]